MACHCGGGCFAIGAPLTYFAQYSIDQGNAHISARGHSTSLSKLLQKTETRQNAILTVFWARVVSHAGEIKPVSPPPGFLTPPKMTVSARMGARCSAQSAFRRVPPYAHRATPA